MSVLSFRKHTYYYATLYAAATAQVESTVHHIHDATIVLVSLDRQMLGNTARAVVPAILYRKYKALYLELREVVDGGGGRRIHHLTVAPAKAARITSSERFVSKSFISDASSAATPSSGLAKRRRALSFTCQYATTRLPPCS